MRIPAGLRLDFRLSRLSNGATYPMKRDTYLWSAILFSAASHIVAFLQFSISFASLQLPERWFLQFAILVGASFACALLQFLLRRSEVVQAVLLFVRLLVLFIATYPLGNSTTVRTTLVASFVFETMIYYAMPASMIGSLALIAASLFLRTTGPAWDRQVATVSLDSLLFTGFYPLIIMVLGAFLKNARQLAADRKTLIEQLRQASTSLVKTNIQLQEHVVRGEEQAKLLERARISRELHDTIGYTLMNIIATMKASLELSRSDTDRMREFMTKGIEQAQKGLMETREALRTLRAAVPQPLSLIETVDRLVNAFKDTHISLSAHYSNMPWSLGEEIDSTIYRIVQEGITNAIRHGNASEIAVNLSFDGKRIGVAVRDNGIGAGEITEGIGMAGIRERLTRVAGELSVENSAAGFVLYARIPVAG
jgi:signal transduction histidine kinase